MDRPGGVEEGKATTATRNLDDVNKTSTSSPPSGNHDVAAASALPIEPAQQPKSGAPTPDGADAAIAKALAAEAGEERNVVASEPATRAGSEEDGVDGIRVRASSLPAAAAAAAVANDPPAPAPKPADASPIAPQEDRSDRADAPGVETKPMEVDAAGEAARIGDSGAAEAAAAATTTAVAAVEQPSQPAAVAAAADGDNKKEGEEEPGPPPFPARCPSLDADPALLAAATTLSDILASVSRTDADAFFGGFVSAQYVPGYYSSVKKPMCFAMMQAKVHARQYETWGSLVADFELICSNAAGFNRRKSRVHRAALALQRSGRRTLAAREAQLNSNARR